MSAPKYDLEAVKAVLSMEEVCRRDGLELQREGGNLVASCPFHTQRGKSFTIHAGSPHHAHCYGAGCGWKGDVFQFYKDRRGCSFPEAVAALAGLAGIAPVPEGVAWSAPVKTAPETLEERGKPDLPELMWLPRPHEVEGLALLREVSPAAVERMARERLLGITYWPLDKETGKEYSKSRLSWVVTDDSRWCAQFRPLMAVCEGCGHAALLSVSRQCAACGSGAVRGVVYGPGKKAWSTRNPRWPVGAANLRGRTKVWLVEGGADMLAAFHLLEAVGAEDVAVCAVFGGSSRICQEGKEALQGAAVTIWADYDPKEGVETVPGWMAAARWQEDLTGMAASVQVVNLAPLGVKDLGELVAGGGWQDVDFAAVL